MGVESTYGRLFMGRSGSAVKVLDSQSRGWGSSQHTAVCSWGAVALQLKCWTLSPGDGGQVNIRPFVHGAQWLCS